MKARFKATVNLKMIMERTVSVDKYINGMAQPFKGKFSERKQTYQLKEEAVQKLKSHAKDIVIVVFSAEW